MAQSCLLAMLLLTCQHARGSILPAEGDGGGHAGGEHGGGHGGGEHADGGHAGGGDFWETKKWELAKKMDEITEKMTLFKMKLFAKKLEPFLPKQPGCVKKISFVIFLLLSFVLGYVPMVKFYVQRKFVLKIF
jgi:hypothetical protein